MLPLPEINFTRTPVTLTVAAVAVALEVVSTIDETQRLHYYNEWLGLLPHIWMGEPWRPFTSALMHGNLLHAAFNIYWLMIFGPALENRFGSYLTLALIVLLGYVSMLPEYIIGSYNREEPIMIVGLSGVIYGLFGVLFVGRRWHREFEAVCDEHTVRILIGWFFLCVVFTYSNIMSVANIAHGAGFVFGVLYGLAAFDARHRFRWAAVATLASLVVLSTLIACPGHKGYQNALQIKKARQIQRLLNEVRQSDGL